MRINFSNIKNWYLIIQNRFFKLNYIPLVIVLILILVFSGIGWFLNQRGYQINFSIIKHNYQTYHHESPKFSFSYPTDVFNLDTGQGSNFGETYLIGIKPISDQRIGCDVRATSGELNLSSDVSEIGKQLDQQLSKNIAIYQSSKYSFTKIGGEKAVKVQITYSGPPSETMVTDQIFTSYNGLIFNLVCGTTQATYPFFTKDFAHFFKTFSFN